MDGTRIEHRRTVRSDPAQSPLSSLPAILLLLGWCGACSWGIRHGVLWPARTWELGVGLVITWWGGRRIGLLALILLMVTRIAATYVAAKHPLLLAEELWRAGAVLIIVVWVGQRRLAWLEEHAMARLDGLTKLPNRQALAEQLEAELGRAERFHRPFAVAVLDCDGFKLINDRQGHMVGDAALVAISRSLRSSLRRYDFVARTGGDEFVLIISEADLFDVEHIVERLLTGLRHSVERQFPTLTVSIGVVVFRTPPERGEICVMLADAAMYRAKEMGKNRVVFEVHDTPRAVGIASDQASTMPS